MTRVDVEVMQVWSAGALERCRRADLDLWRNGVLETCRRRVEVDVWWYGAREVRGRRSDVEVWSLEVRRSAAGVTTRRCERTELRRHADAEALHCRCVAGE